MLVIILRYQRRILTDTTFLPFYHLEFARLTDFECKNNIIPHIPVKQLAQGRKLAFNMYVQFHWLGGRVTTRKITQQRLVFIALMCLNFISHIFTEENKKKFIKIGVLVAKWKQIRSVEKIVLNIEILRPVWFLPIFLILDHVWGSWNVINKACTSIIPVFQSHFPLYFNKLQV